VEVVSEIDDPARCVEAIHTRIGGGVGQIGDFLPDTEALTVGIRNDVVAGPFLHFEN
jgi:hypothetical protein